MAWKIQLWYAIPTQKIPVGLRPSWITNHFGKMDVVDIFDFCNGIYCIAPPTICKTKKLSKNQYRFPIAYRVMFFTKCVAKSTYFNSATECIMICQHRNSPDQTAIEKNLRGEIFHSHDTSTLGQIGEFIYLCE